MFSTNTYKVVLCGPATAGKTCLCCRWTSGCWVEDPSPTLGAAYSLLRIDLQSSTSEAQSETRGVELQLWDTAGQELYRSLCPLYLRGCSCAIIVLDSTLPASRLKEQLEEWVYTSQQGSPGCLVFVCLSKVDLISSATERELLSRFSSELGYRVHSTSAKTGVGCSSVLESIVQSLEDRSTPVQYGVLRKKFKGGDSVFDSKKSGCGC